MDALSEVLVSWASQSPFIAFLLYMMWQQRLDYEKRIESKNDLITKYRERDWTRVDRLENTKS